MAKIEGVMIGDNSLEITSVGENVFVIKIGAATVGLLGAVVNDQKGRWNWHFFDRQTIRMLRAKAIEISREADSEKNARESIVKDLVYAWT